MSARFASGQALRRLFFAGLTIAAVATSPVRAAVEAAPPAPSPAAPELAAPASADPALEARVQALAHKLRCLVCQNQSIAESDADLAQDLRAQVREQLAAGRSEKQVVDYLVDRYGDFVLYEPPFKADTLFLWLGPGVLLAAAAGWLALRLRRRAVESPIHLTEAEHARARALLEGAPLPDAQPPRGGVTARPVAQPVSSPTHPEPLARAPGNPPDGGGTTEEPSS